MPSFGEKLKQEREKRKMTLEEISVSTKIGTRMLQALEEDKFNQLPGGIFNKGFVRAYSRCVGLDEDQAVADYLQASGDAPAVSTEIAIRDDEARENAEKVTRLEALADSPRRQVPWGLFAAALLLIALALSLWSHRRQQSARQAVRPASRALAPIPASSENSTPAAGQGASATVLPPGSEGASAAVPVKAQPAPAQQSQTSASAPSQNEFQVMVRAREESWVSHTVDGEASVSETLAAGSERIFRGRKEIIVKMGNAGGVDISFNGKKQDLGGETGQVRTVTFGPLGIVENPPATPATH